MTEGSASVLFTSHRALREAEKRLAGSGRYPPLVQGQAARRRSSSGSARGGAVLLGTGSFWEGVDVPGNALSQVIIDKLPFAPPTDR